ncbi:MAG: hypothetical protein OSB69_11355 [Alphaproteobacteria bacterium]|nr:hypothetical protein [Alphaproteobacteria bacterium]
MTIISRRVVTPHPGKFDTVIERLRIGEGALQRAGGDTLLMKITYGQMAGSIALFGLFEDFIAATAATDKLAADVEMQKLAKQRQEDPAGLFMGPDVLRVAYGKTEKKPVMMVRTYQVDRINLEAALEVLPKVEELVKKSGATVTGLIPMISDNMDRLNVIYGFDSTTHMGESVHSVGTSEEFQKLVVEANKTGKLMSTRVQQSI